MSEMKMSGCLTCRWFDASNIIEEQELDGGNTRNACLSVYTCAVAEDAGRPTDVRNDAADYVLDSGDGCPYREQWDPENLHHIFDDNGDAYTRRFGAEWKYDTEQLSGEEEEGDDDSVDSDGIIDMEFSKTEAREVSPGLRLIQADDDDDDEDEYAIFDEDEW